MSCIRRSWRGDGSVHGGGTQERRGPNTADEAASKTGQIAWRLTEARDWEAQDTWRSRAKKAAATSRVGLLHKLEEVRMTCGKRVCERMRAPQTTLNRAEAGCPIGRNLLPPAPHFGQ